MTAPAPILDLAASLARARASAVRTFLNTLQLPPRLTGSEWADRYRILSPESSSEPGPWHTDRVPYLREIMDVLTGRDYIDITLVKCSQSGGTELINNAVGFYIDQEPSPLLVIQPNEKPMGMAWSKDRLAPMLRDCPRLRGKVTNPASRNSGNTILHKTFAGGHITVIGANAPSGLASRPIRIILGDEMDRWGASAGTEGDPWALATARTTTFRHRKKLVKVSTPGDEGKSRIEREWDRSDQRHFYVPCPHCGHEQPLEWRDTGGRPGIVQGKGKFRLVWERDGEGDKTVHKPETACYQCRACEALIEETHKAAMLAAGRWVSHNPASRRAGWHVGGLLSPWRRWREVAAAWLDAMHDPEERKTFFNTVLGLLYQEEGEVPDALALVNRREKYPAEVPGGVGVLTAAIDVQGDRLELEVRGWGEREESWQIRLERILGDPDGDEVWARAEEVLKRPWHREDGAVLRVYAAVVDSGYKTDRVYKWVKPRQAARIYATKGVDNQKAPIARASRTNRDGVKVFNFNPSMLKDVLFARLRRPAPGPGYLHFGLESQTGAPDDYYAQFAAETRRVEFIRGAFVVSYVRPTKKPNEAIDLYTGNLVALRTLGVSFVDSLGTRAAKPGAGTPPTPAVEGEEAASDGSAVPPPTPAAPSPSPYFARRLRPRGW